MTARGTPVFIIGSYRSGTSITTWCIGQHPNIWVIPETYWIARFAEDLQQLWSLGTAQRAAHFNRCKLTEEDLRDEAATFVNRLVELGQQRRLRGMLDKLLRGGSVRTSSPLQRGAREPKRRWVDGTPENIHHVAALHQLFPGARFIHLVRSPHEVVRSLQRFDRAGGQPYSADEGYAVWRQMTQAGFDAEQALGSNVVCRFFYDDLTENPDHTLHAMLKFAGETYRAACIEPLQQRINSSRVEDEALLTADTVPEHLQQTFEDNDTWYRTLRDTPPMQPAATG